MDNLLGKNLGRYHIIEPLGQGGMAAVYKAFDTSLERNVAVKIIRSDKKEGTEQNEFLKRFQREAKALAQLDHPYILKVLDYGEQDGMPYLVMPFVQGGTLKEKMGRPMPFREAAVLLAPIAQALEYAHKRKVIHRDVKPANILVGESGTPLLSDFGIAKIIESGESTQLTGTGVGIGTPDYMAPEQWMGKADARTDIYSLGIVLFQMVTGHLPYTADTPAAVLIKHMQDPLPRPKSFVAELPDAAEQILFKALAKDPESRFHDMAAFADALGKLAAGVELNLADPNQYIETVHLNLSGEGGGPTQLIKPQTVTTQPAKKNGLPIWAIGLMAVAVLAVAAVFAVQAIKGLITSRIADQLSVPTTVSEIVDTAAVIPSIVPSLAPTIAALQPTFEAIATAEASPVKAPFLTIEGLPPDIPVLTINNGDLMTSKQQDLTMYYFSTSMTLKEVADFYLTEMAKNQWEVVNETTQADMYYYMFMKGETRQVMISATTQDEATVGVSIMIQ